MTSITHEFVLLTWTGQFIRPVLAVVSLVTHVVPGDAASVLTRELVLETRTRGLVLHVVTVSDTVTLSVSGDALTIAAVKLVVRARFARGSIATAETTFR